jgi:hypothetical protein
MRITVKHLLMMCIPSLAIACTPKEPVKNLALSFDDGPNIIESTWFSISAFSGKDITNLEAITRGAIVHVIGRLKCNRYVDANGNDCVPYEIVAREVDVVKED